MQLSWRALLWVSASSQDARVAGFVESREQLVSHKAMGLFKVRVDTRAHESVSPHRPLYLSLNHLAVQSGGPSGRGIRGLCIRL